MGTLALIEILDRDGSVRHSQRVGAWPLRVGRALDNDLVLDDPHVAAHHFTVDANDDGVYLAVGDTLNGVTVGAQQLAAGERWQAAAVPSTIVAGRVHLRLRLAEHAVAPERRLASSRVLAQGLGLVALLLVLNTAAMMFSTYLETDPEPLWRTLATNLKGAVVVLLVWCGGWTLLSKLFTRQGHFAWHVRVLLTAVLAWQATDALLSVLAFAFSWPGLSSFTYVIEMAIAAATLYLHLQAVEPHRPHLTRAFAVGALVVGIGLSAWNNWQRTESLGSDLYLSTLLPPAVRVAKPVDADAFVSTLAPLQERLDAKAKQAADADGDKEIDDDE